MSNIIKAEQINGPKYITLRIPLWDTGETSEQKRRKMLEECDELLDEFSTGPVNQVDALAEMFDVIQVALGYVFARNREENAEYNPLMMTDVHFRDANNRHLYKMKKYATERGWVDVRE